MRILSTMLLMVGLSLIVVASASYAVATDKKCKVAGTDACALTSTGCTVSVPKCFHCEEKVYRTCSGVSGSCTATQEECGMRYESPCESIGNCKEEWGPSEHQCTDGSDTKYDWCPFTA